MNNHELVNAIERNGGAVIKGMGAIEAGMACGVYTAVNTGPIEQLRSEYTDLTIAIAAAEVAGLHLRAGALQKMLNAIPTEEKWRDAGRSSFKGYQEEATGVVEAFAPLGMATRSHGVLLGVIQYQQSKGVTYAFHKIIRGTC